MGVNPFNSYGPSSSTGSISLPPASGKTISVLWRWSTLHPPAHPPKSYFSALMSLPPAARSSHVYTHISHILLVHSSERMLQVGVFCHRGCFNGCWRSQWSVLRQGTEQGLATQRNESSCFQQCPGFRISACSECWEDLGEPRASGRLWSHFPSSVLAASPCGCSSCFSQPGESLRTLPEKPQSMASTFSIANLSFSFHQISYCSHAQSWFRCYLFYRWSEGLVGGPCVFLSDLPTEIIMSSLTCVSTHRV